MKQLPVFIAFAFALALAGLGPFLAVHAQEREQEPQLVEIYKDWRVYHYISAEEELCYIVSEPISKRPRGVNRGQVLFTVTHRGGVVRNEVGWRAGYQFSSTSKPFAKIGGREFSFYTGVKEGDDERAHWAWMRNSEEEEDLVAAMKGGNTMTIKGTSSRGTLTTDRYSLLGFTKALERIDEICK